jgi:hypothetical protein
MTTKLISYGTWMYPSIPNTTQHMLCGHSSTDLFLWDVKTSTGVPLSSVSQIHIVHELKKASETSILLRS